MINSAIQTILDERRERHLSDLFELLRFPSDSQQESAAGCRPCAEWLVDYLVGLGATAEVVETAGQPCVIGHLGSDAAKPTVLLYGHYDVQPASPLDLWNSDPFEPVIRDGAIYARGANDNKGQFFAHLMAIDAMQAAGGLPVNVKFLIEGEEEIGSPTMEAVLVERAAELRADALVISDTPFFDAETPSMVSALRGMLCGEIIFKGPSRDLHSGSEGGRFRNPINAIARLVAGMHDEQGRVTIPGFYDAVRPIDEATRQAWAALAFDESAYATSLGVEALAGGELGYSALERTWARPTLDCNGIDGGYTGQGVKMVLPSQAVAKFSVRSVADQEPAALADALETYVRQHTPIGITSETVIFSHSRPVQFRTDTPAFQAAVAAMTDAFGKKPVIVHEGASIPITEAFQRVLGLDAILMGMGLPTDCIHSPNEHFRLTQLHRGATMCADFYTRVGTMLKGDCESW
jgi:acetylornithine deacetylase/succinyl-diaminopimelate desuccinylase-like protein